MDIKTHVTKMASALKSQQTAGIKTVGVLKAFINEATLGDALIQNYIDQVQEQAIAKGVLKSSSATMKSQIKKVLKLAMTHKEDVIKLAENAGNLDQWYKACLDAKDPSRNKTHKVNKPKAQDLPKLQDEAKEPSEVTSPIDQFKTALRAMLDSGMTMHQIQTIIAQEIEVAKAA